MPDMDSFMPSSPEEADQLVGEAPWGLLEIIDPQIAKDAQKATSVNLKIIEASLERWRKQKS